MQSNGSNYFMPHLHLTGGEKSAYYIDGNDINPNGYSFKISQDNYGSTNHPTVDLHNLPNSEIFEPQGQSAMTMSNVTSASGEASVSSGNRGDGDGSTVQGSMTTTGQPFKKKRNFPGTPDPEAEVIALSPKTLMATNRFVCEICNKGFQRDQNLQLHRRGHNLPWKLKQRASKEIRKRVYICPESSCVHHDPRRALGDLTGIKKHFCRKHGEKKWKCERCLKKYAVQSDWKAHSKTCGTREYRCDCGTLFSRRDSFITHRAFCDALAEENARISSGSPECQQHPGNHNSGALVASQQGGPVGMNCVSSPGQVPMIQLEENTVQPLSTITLRAGFSPGTSKVGLSQNGLSLLPPRWEQANARHCGARPRLNLWLGTGPGPGPPAKKLVIGGPQQLQAGGSSFVNPLDVTSADNGAAITCSFGAISESEDHKAILGLMPFGLSNTHYDNFSAPGGIFGGMTGSLFSQSDGTAVVGVSDLADLGCGTDWTNATRNLSLSSSAGLASNLVSMNMNNGGVLSSPCKQPSAQMSATALLQKATQMGARVSNPSLLQGLRIACPNYSNSGTAWEGLGLDQGLKDGMASMVSKFMKTGQQMRSSGDLPSTQFGETTTSENGSLHELMGSLSGSGSLFANFPPLPVDSGSLERIIQFQHSGQVQSGLQGSYAGSQPLVMGGSVLAGLGNFHRAEDAANDGLTRDFLGVGGQGGIAGATTSGAKALSGRDFTSITSGLDMSTFCNPRGELPTLGVNSQSSGKSRDT